MCFLVDDADEGAEDAGKGSSGAPKLQLRRHHTWLIPRRAVGVIFTVAVIFCVLGMVLMAIGGGVGHSGLKITGGVLFGLGILGVILCFFVCQFAYFMYGTRTQAVQTDAAWTEDGLQDMSGYSTIGRPSALKSADSTLKRNGAAGQKKVTMAPEVGPYAGVQPSSPVTVQGQSVDPRLRPQESPTGGGSNISYGEVSDPRGVGGRSVAGANVGTGGIRITTLERTQSFPLPGSQGGYGSGQVGYGSGQAGYGTGQAGYGTGQAYVTSGQGGYSHSVYSGGGSSASSSVVDATYAYPKSVHGFSGQESAYSESLPNSQYSTLRSIPVTHVVHEGQGPQQDSIQYARINKQARVGPTIVQGQGHSSQVINQVEQRFPTTDDFDYDNPVERTPMIHSGGQHQQSGYGASYHERQMQYQRQQHHPDLYAPRHVDTSSLQRQTAGNPFTHHKRLPEELHNHTPSSPSFNNSIDDDLPDLQPLVYPSARRPMTFEQVSSSKMSVYDNVLAGLKDEDE